MAGTPSGALSGQVVDELVSVVGAAHVLTDADAVAGYSTDWTGRFVGATPAVVRPGSTDEVAGVLAVCHRHGVAVVPQGGNTGLVGGGVPLGGEVVLSVRRLNRIGAVDQLARAVTAGAGVTIAELARAAADAGLAYAVDLGSRDSATVGGTIATNAGGLQVVRWGPTRAQLLGIEAVLADGTVISHLAGLAKDNTGYDLAGLLCGSEGTLGVITAARLRLVAAPSHHTVALAGFADVHAAVDAATTWAGTLAGVEAVELVTADGVGLVCDTLGLAEPLAARWPAYVLVGASGPDDPTDAVAEAVMAVAAVGDVAVARTAAERHRLWRYREAHTEAINRIGTPHKMDVTLPAAELAGFITDVPGVVTAVAPAARTWLFGHAGDGNVHVNVTGVAHGDDAVDDAVLRLVASRGGSISAEHGIGTAKKRWLELNRSPAELATFAAIRRALDPAGIMNPGVLVDAGYRPPATPTGPA